LALGFMESLLEYGGKAAYFVAAKNLPRLPPRGLDKSAKKIEI